MRDEVQYPETWQKSIAQAEELGRARERIAALEAGNVTLRATLKSIAEYCSGDDRALGAIERLAAIRNTAEQALRVHEQSAPNRCEHGLQRDLCGKCSVGLEIK